MNKVIPVLLLIALGGCTHFDADAAYEALTGGEAGSTCRSYGFDSDGALYGWCVAHERELGAERASERGRLRQQIGIVEKGSACAAHAGTEQYEPCLAQFEAALEAIRAQQ